MRRERPIIFSGEMVRAILAGRKTQTRRVVTLCEFRPSDTPGYDWQFRDRRSLWNDVSTERLLQLCPWGRPGDRLWVRETWRHYDWTDCGEPFVEYRADQQVRLIEGFPWEWSERLVDRWAELSAPDNFAKHGAARDSRWRSSIYMPRWVSRITLAVTAVRVESSPWVWVVEFRKAEA